MLEWRQQANGDPAAEAKAWGAKLVEAERKREKYQEMFAEEAMILEELKAELEVLEETRDKAKRELSSLADKREELEAIERDMDQILESCAALAPEALGMLFPQRNAGRYTLYLISPSRLWPTEH